MPILGGQEPIIGDPHDPTSAVPPHAATAAAAPALAETMDDIPVLLSAASAAVVAARSAPQEGPREQWLEHDRNMTNLPGNCSDRRAVKTVSWICRRSSRC